MAASPYSIETVDLTVVTTTPREIVRPGRAISSVAVLVLASGAAFKLHMGQGPGIPCIAQGFQMRSRPRRDVQGNCTYPALGLYASVDTASAATAIIMVTYGDEGLLEISGGGTPAAFVSPSIASGARFSQLGSVNDTATIWLVNPIATGVSTFRVHSLRAWTSDTAVQMLVVDYEVGAGAGGVITEGGERWEDRRKSADAPPRGQVRGVTFADDATRALTAIQRSVHAIATQNPPDHLTELIKDSERWYLKPGSSMLLRGFANGAGVQVSGMFVWDEAQ